MVQYNIDGESRGNPDESSTIFCIRDENVDFIMQRKEDQE